MATRSPEGQLELFELGQQPAPRMRRTPVGRMVIQVRYDQLMLGLMGALMGVTVIFAGGVERGKRLVRAERMLLAREQPADEAAAKAKPKSSPAPASAPTKVKPRSRLAEEAPAPAAGTTTAVEPARATGEPVSAPRPAPVAQPTAGRYAVQVVTYSRPQLAKRELDRLQAQGERAFLVMRNGRTIVYVGPFPSQGNAREKSVSLKTRYADCFVKSL